MEVNLENLFVAIGYTPPHLLQHAVIKNQTLKSDLVHICAL